MSSKEHPIIIFLDRNSFIIYQDTLSNIWQFPFSQDLVVNLDVINREQLVSSIESFIQTNKVIPSTLILVLSDSVIFQKDLASLQTSPGSQIDLSNKEQQEKEIKNFLDNVPFEEVLAKVINGTRIVAANKDLVESVIYPFKKIGCVVDAVVPGFIYQQYIDFSGGLSSDTARIILQQGEILKLGNMLTDQKEVAIQIQQDSSEPSQKTPKEKPSNLRQFILIGLLVFLLIVLVIVYLTLGRSSQTAPKKNVSQPLESQSVSSPTTVLRVEPTGSVDLKTIKITIVGNKEIEVVSNALKNLLTQSGFQNVTIEPSTNPVPARSSVLFSKSISDSSRQKAILEIKKIFSDILVQESQELDAVITIVIGKS